MSSETGYNPGTETCHTLYDRGGKRASGNNATWRFLFILLYGRERAGHFVEEWTVADCGRILLEDALHLIYASRREKGKGCFYYTHMISDVKSIITLTCGAMEQQLGSEDCMRGSLGPHAKSRVGSTSYAHGIADPAEAAPHLLSKSPLLPKVKVGTRKAFHCFHCFHCFQCIMYIGLFQHQSLRHQHQISAPSSTNLPSFHQTPACSTCLQARCPA